MTQNAVILGITGERNVGKTTVLEYLRGRYHFAVGHPFNVGKEMLKTYYKYVGVEPHIAHDMVYGNLKDHTCNRLPDNSTSRFFMEELGKFLGETMGPAWSAGAEVKKLGHHRRMAIDSIVYEDLWLHEAYPQAKIIRIEGPDRSENGTVAHHTSTAQSKVKEDVIVYNNGTKEKLFWSIDLVLKQLYPGEFKNIA